MLRILCVTGLPNSGKTTFANTLGNNGSFIIHTDDFADGKYGGQSLFDVLHDHKAEGIVIIDTDTLVTKCDRRYFLNGISDQKNRVSCVFLNTDTNELIRRENRGRNAYSSSRRKIEFPSVDEGFLDVLIIHNNIYKEGEIECLIQRLCSME